MRVALLSLILALSLPALLASAARTVDREYKDRIVDQAALSSKQSAIRALEALIRQRRGTSDEPRLEMALAELQRDCADFEFRVAHGNARFEGKPADLREYDALLESTIQLLTGFMQQYPTNPKVPRAYYLRGKAFLELGRKQDADADFKTLIARYPNSEDFKLGTLSEIDLLMSLKDYAGVLQYVGILHASPSDSRYYALALDRKAWAEYYLKDIPAALQSLGDEVRYLNGFAGPRAVDRENVYDGVALLYESAMEQKLAGYTAPNACAYFKGIAASAGTDSMLVQLAYLIRAKGRDDDLEALLRSSLASGVGACMPAGLPEKTKLDLILVTFENQVNRYRYAQLKDSIGYLDQWCSRNRSGIPVRGRKAMDDAAASLQRAFVGAQDSPAVLAPIGSTLLELYALVLKLPDSSGGKAVEERMKVHFNMAEISFTLKDYADALTHYRWVVDHQRSRDPAAQALASQSALKAISSKYELLSAQGRFPDDLEAKPLSVSSTQRIPSDIKTWIRWLDDFMSSSNASDRAHGEVFLFEANRLLYSLGDVSDATERMADGLGKYQDPKFAVASAALVLDTYVASQQWQKAYDVGSRVLVARKWDPEFQQRIQRVLGDSYFKLTEQQYKNKSYAAVMDRAGTFLAQYPQNPERDGCILLAANSALAVNDKAGALRYFSMLKQTSPEQDSQILLTRIALAEENHDYPSAVNDLVAYLALPGSPSDSMRQKAALYEFLGADTQPVSERLSRRGVCVAQTKSYCEHLDALAELGSGVKLSGASERRAAASSLAKGADSPIWGVIALRNPAALSIGQRESILDALSAQWASEEPIAKFIVASDLPPVLLKNLEVARLDASSSAKVRRIQKKLIDRRIQRIAELARMCGKSMKMPWASVQVGALKELAAAYSDFAGEIRALRPPSGLAGQDLADYRDTITQMTAPFDKKAADYDKQSMTVAAAAPPEPDSEPGSLLKLVQRFEQGEAGRAASGQQLLQLWADALKARDWGRVAFFVNQLKGGGISAPECKLAEALSIYFAGGRAEGLAELKEVQSDLNRDLRGALADALDATSSRLPAAVTASRGPGGGP